ncbi:PQQ-binding-like beta-propeller repeat protein [Akkermansiaceae bacterium]|nr:PQQ-binding-like beta-propeller repeat protein [Akkermansiaceae bacterium]
MALGADWPMWRNDTGRTAQSAEVLAENLSLQWSRRLPPLKPAYRDNRLQFDAGYEPIVLGKRLVVGSSRDDSVTAFDTETGEEVWKFFTDGPVRFAPVGGEGKIIFGSDDGCLYCVNASDGSLVWKKRAVPSKRKVIGNERMISVWPIRGGPVLHEGRVYFAAGVWPLEGTFVFCVDAATGETIWRNDRSSYRYGVHPHNAKAFGGLAPQGYLLIDDDTGHLIVPSSQAYPAKFDLQTGELKSFELPAPGRLPGGWFASTPSELERQKLKRRGLLFDNEVNYRVHEGKPHFKGEKGVRNKITVAGREMHFSDGYLEVEGGSIHSMLVADEKIFVVTKAGKISCFGSGLNQPIKHKPGKVSLAKVQKLGVFSKLDQTHGYALLLGAGDDPGLIESLLAETSFRVIVVDSRPEKVRELRKKKWTNSATGEHLSIIEDEPTSVVLPPYFAELIVIGNSTRLDATQLKGVYESLRPFGGKLMTRLYQELPNDLDLDGAKRSRTESGWTVMTREGALSGSANYEGNWEESWDKRVRGPLGILWFDDSLSHFKRSPQPKFIDGVMISTPKDWTDETTRTGKVDYRLLAPVFSDVYTGRILSAKEVPALRKSFSNIDLETVQPSQYRPPRQKDDWKPKAPQAGTRTNPMTLESEPRVFPKSYGCDGGVDYGLLYTMRSGTPAFYDKQLESGTINISGPRSGCTNSIIPANGLLNLPYFYEGCTCSYPLPMAVALVGMPPEFEQWASWGELPLEKTRGKIQVIGINLGAPGDRVTEDGTMWLDQPEVGGPSPEIDFVTVPPLAELEKFYHHSLFHEGGKSWPWVAGSGVKGLHSAILGGLMPGSYDVRLVFCEPDGSEKLPVFSVVVNGDQIIDELNVVEKAGGVRRGYVLEATSVRIGDEGNLRIDLGPKTGKTVLSGINLRRANQ